MSRLTTLFHSAIDHVFPPAWPDLSGLQFFTAIPGAWRRDDNRGLCTWGYASLRLPVDTEDFANNFERFVSAVSQMDIASVHVGLASWPAPESDLQDWYAAQSATESLSLLDLAQSRKTWLKSLGLRERLGYVIVRVKLDGDDDTQRDKLAMLQNTLQDLAFNLGHGHRPLTRAEVVRLDAECKTQGKEGIADYVLEEHHAPAAPVLMQAFAWADHGGYAQYQATLDIVPNAGSLRAAAHLRVHNPKFGLRTLETELHRCGIMMRKTAVRRLMHFPRQREVSRWKDYRWDDLSEKKLVALAPCAARPTASVPRAGGVPLRSMTGELRTFAPFDSSTTYNTLVVGEKAPSHEVACDALAAHLASGGVACVIADTGDFSHLANVLEGEVQQFTTDGPQGLDPLGLGTDEYDITSFALKWLGSLVDGQQPSESVRFLLSEALSMLWRNYPRDQVTLASLHRVLLEMPDPRAQNIAEALAPYVADGPYAMLFAGPSREVPENALTVYDLSAWKDDAILPHLTQAVLRLQTENYDRRNMRAIRKLFVHSLSKAHEAQLGPFESWLRIARRYNMGAIVLARPADVEPGGAYCGFWQNFANIIALSLTKAAAEELRLDRHVWDASIWQLNTSSLYGNSHSMRAITRMLLVTPEGAGFFELRLDPASRELYARSQAPAADGGA